MSELEEANLSIPTKKKRNRKVFNKKQLVKMMQERYLKDLGLTNRLVTKIVDGFLKAYCDALVDNKRVEIASFGTMRRELMKGRLLVHPSSKKEAIASPYYRLSFKPTRELKEILRKAALEEVKKLEG